MTLSDPRWNTGPLLCGKEAERQAVRDRAAARAETRKHYAAAVGFLLFLAAVVFLSCAA